MKMRNKGVVSKAFTFILFILVAGAVLVLGYKWIGGLMQQQCEATKASFQTEVVNLFDEYDDYGSVQKEDLNLPCDYRAVCFIDSGANESDERTGFPDWVADTDEETMEQNLANNIFLIGEFADPIDSADKVKVDKGNPDNTVLCVQGSPASVVFEGKGNETVVREG